MKSYPPDEDEKKHCDLTGARSNYGMPPPPSSPSGTEGKLIFDVANKDSFHSQKDAASVSVQMPIIDNLPPPMTLTSSRYPQQPPRRVLQIGDMVVKILKDRGWGVVPVQSPLGPTVFHVVRTALGDDGLILGAVVDHLPGAVDPGDAVIDAENEVRKAEGRPVIARAAAGSVMPSQLVDRPVVGK